MIIISRLYFINIIDSNDAMIIKTVDVSLASLQTELAFKIFVLDENFVIFEMVRYNNPAGFGPALISRGLGEHEMWLYSIEADEQMQIKDCQIAVSGIDKIIPLHGNICAIKLGSAVLEEEVKKEQHFDNQYEELIGLINVKQFISDLKLIRKMYI